MRSLAPAVAALVLLTLSAPATLAAQPAPAPAAEPTPVAPSPTPVPAQPAAAPIPSPPSPSPVPSPVPAASPSDSPYHYVVTPPAPAPGQPVILEIDLLDSTIHAGQPYSVRVKTSPDVTGINVSAMGQTYGMQAARPGLYASDGQVPAGVPFFMLGRNYTVTVTALAPGGKSTTVELSLRLDR
jgi:outer membrane biosynthesis protein TonB